MRKMKAVCFLALMSISSGRVLGQTFEKSLFAEICNSLDKQNSYIKLKATIPGTYLIEDATTGQQTIKYGSNSKGLVEFKKFSTSEQKEILKVPELPIFPLKDTVYILDTSNFFSEELSYKSKNTFFQLVSESGKEDANRTIIFGSKAVRGSQFWVAMSFKKNINSLVYRFNIDCNKFKLLRWSFVENKHIKE